MAGEQKILTDTYRNFVKYCPGLTDIQNYEGSQRDVTIIETLVVPVCMAVSGFSTNLLSSVYFSIYMYMYVYIYIYICPVDWTLKLPSRIMVYGIDTVQFRSKYNRYHIRI